MPNCLTCGAGIDEYDSGYYSRSMLCIPCYSRKSTEVAMASCSRCGTRVRSEEARRKGGAIYCSYCVSELERVERMPVCGMCSKKIESWQKTFRMANGQLVHSECASAAPGRMANAFCSICGKQVDYFRILPGGKAICPKCDRESKESVSKKAIVASLIDKIGAMIG